MEEAILEAMQRAERHLSVTRRTERGVFPWSLEAWLDVPRCEQQLRKDMRKLARQGKLERIGGFGARRGYRMSRYGKMRLRFHEIMKGGSGCHLTSPPSPLSDNQRGGIKKGGTYATVS